MELLRPARGSWRTSARSILCGAADLGAKAGASGRMSIRTMVEQDGQGMIPGERSLRLTARLGSGSVKIANAPKRQHLAENSCTIASYSRRSTKG